MNTKICSKCGIEKSVDDFYVNKNMKDGLQYCCKECSKKMALEYKNTDKYKKWLEKYCKTYEYREYQRACQREYRRKKKLINNLLTGDRNDI